MTCTEPRGGLIHKSDACSGKCGWRSAAAADRSARSGERDVLLSGARGRGALERTPPGVSARLPSRKDCDGPPPTPPTPNPARARRDGRRAGGERDARLRRRRRLRRPGGRRQQRPAPARRRRLPAGPRARAAGPGPAAARARSARARGPRAGSAQEPSAADDAAARTTGDAAPSRTGWPRCRRVRFPSRRSSRRTVPRGGVQAGAGGTALTDTPQPLPAIAIAALLLGLLSLGSGLRAVRR